MSRRRLAKAIKLVSVAEYWRGDERNPMLQRIYGLRFRTRKPSMSPQR
jgi:threonyl-tRNA synthetase